MVGSCHLSAYGAVLASPISFLINWGRREGRALLRFVTPVQIPGPGNVASILMCTLDCNMLVFCCATVNHLEKVLDLGNHVACKAVMLGSVMLTCCGCKVFVAFS